MPSIVIYSTPTCPFCIMAKNFFKKHNIAYNEKDVAADQMAAQEMIKKSGQMGVPVIEVDNEIMVGFDEERLKKRLKTQIS